MQKPVKSFFIFFEKNLNDNDGLSCTVDDILTKNFFILQSSELNRSNVMQPSHPAEEKASASQSNIQEVINACDTILQSGRDQSLNSVEWFALSMITNWLPDQLTTLSASALSCGGGNPRESKFNRIMFNTQIVSIKEQLLQTQKSVAPPAPPHSLFSQKRDRDDDDNDSNNLSAENESRFDR